MLSLMNITKDYTAGDSVVHALRGIDITFRESEFVSILGPSGCGKTTLLNLIGGLDQYTRGDLVINGRSTMQYHDKDWDAYRNHSVGFVFQSYNLIPHQSVLANVELALTISGVSKAERRRRAVSVLQEVGLGDQLRKKPNQMSGGQMQRVAIARALVNDPDILLADEPTGALDSETSVQVMALLKEIARDRLVIMVTHNPELAERYSTRIVRLLDGRITGDTNPCTPEEAAASVKQARTGKTSMSFFTAFSLSLNNLMTKKTRTLLTAFAGSIGIVGIALIMALSNGIQLYIDRVQEDTLSSYPIEIDAQAADFSSLISAVSGAHKNAGETENPDGAVYSNAILYDLLNNLTSVNTQTNDLTAFKAYLDDPDCPIRQYAGAIQYSYDTGFDVYTEDKDGGIVKTDAVELLQSIMTNLYGGDYSAYFDTMGSYYSSFEVWEEMLAGNDGQTISDTVKSQYDVLYGSWPQSYDQVVLVVDSNNAVSDLVLCALGLKTEDELTDAVQAALDGREVESAVRSWSYADICSHTFKLLLPAEYYQYDAASGTYVDMSQTDAGLDYLYNADTVGTTLRISGIVRRNSDAAAGMMQGAIGYTEALTRHLLDTVSTAEVLQKQLASPDTDILTGLPFPSDDAAEPTDAEKAAAVADYVQSLDTAARAAFYTAVMSVPSDDYVNDLVEQNTANMTREYIEQELTASYAAEMGVDQDTVSDYVAGMDDETLFRYVKDAMAKDIRTQYAEEARTRLAALSAEALSAMLDPAAFEAWQTDYAYENLLPARVSDSTYDKNLKKLGMAEADSPSSVRIYAETFENKDAIADAIADYNAAAPEEQQLQYTDYVALLMSSITTILRAISYVLIAFVAISLVVSSIMIGIITYISVLERTKEIGILRAIGASKRDVSHVFNAETLTEGLAAGLMGIGLALVLILPINAIVHHYTGIDSLNAVLPAGGAVSLVAISMLLTFVAGLIPSGIAARRDPVEALRTE